jgi:tripartite-type tricarboxylate transporter receptor subunit TctC
MLRHFLAALILLLGACAPRDQRYPSREVKLVVQATPGGISDNVSRILAAQLEKKLRVPVVCENRPGASGALAFSYVTRRPPDGYTLGHGPVEITMVRTLGYADLGPDNMDLLCLVSKTKPVLVVRTEAPWRDFRQFLDDAGRQPGRLIVANSGTGGIWHFNALLMERECRVRVTHVPFNGSSAALATLLGGHVDAVVAGAGEVISHVQAGRLRVLSVFDPERSPFGASAWSGFYAPRGLPDPIRALLLEAFREAFHSSEFQKLCQQRGMEPVFLDRREFQQFAVAQANFFAREIPQLLRLDR